MMNYDILLAFFGIFGLFFIGIGLMLLTKNKDVDESEGDTNENVDANHQSDAEDIDSEAEEDLDVSDMSKSEKRAAMKRAKKKAKKARAAQLASETTIREEKQSKREEKYNMKLHEREQTRIEEEERLVAEAEAKKAADRAEYDEWKHMFSVELEGTSALDEDESQALLTEFIKYIKVQKVTKLEDIAEKFSITSQEALSRIESLEAEGILTGVFDDRGKFIYITEEEMAKVVAFIKEKGRVSVADLAAHSNRLITLKALPDVESI